MMKCRPRPQLIAFQFACKWFHARAGPRLRNNSNLASRDAAAARHQCGSRIHTQIHKKKKTLKICLDLTSDRLYSKEMTSNLSEGRFQQEAGTAGLAPLSSDDLTEKKTDWINAGIMWPCEVGL